MERRGRFGPECCVHRQQLKKAQVAQVMFDAQEGFSACLDLKQAPDQQHQTRISTS